MSTFVAGSNIYHESVAIQKDGKLVVAGYTIEYSFEGGGKFSLLRYNSDGSLDASFGSEGKVTTDFTRYSDRAYSVAIQKDGKLVVAGSTLVEHVAYNFALARYNSNGSLDETFGIGGKVTTGVGGDFDIAYSVAIQEDGKIVAVGHTSSGYYWTVGSFALVRYNSNGSLDDTFGIGGGQ